MPEARPRRRRAVQVAAELRHGAARVRRRAADRLARGRVEQTEILETQIADRFLRDGLERHRKLQKEPEAISGTPLEQAAKLGRRGELDSARKALAESSSAGAHLLRASFERRDGHGKEALSAVELAAKADDAAEFAARIDHERSSPWRPARISTFHRPRCPHSRSARSQSRG